MGLVRDIAERSVTKPEFREALRKAPREAIEREFGVKIAAEVQLEVHENTDTTVHIVLPAGPSNTPPDVSDEDLREMAGGLRKKQAYKWGSAPPPSYYSSLTAGRYRGC